MSHLRADARGEVKHDRDVAQPRHALLHRHLVRGRGRGKSRGRARGRARVRVRVRIKIRVRARVRVASPPHGPTPSQRCDRCVA